MTDMGNTDDAGNPYDILSCSSSDFGRLQAAIADRAPTLRLHLTRLHDGGGGPLVIEVLVPGVTPDDPWETGSYISRARFPTPELPSGTWHIHHPELGPHMELNSCQQVAKFLGAIGGRFTDGWHEVWGDWMTARGELFANE